MPVPCAPSPNCGLSQLRGKLLYLFTLLLALIGWLCPALVPHQVPGSQAAEGQLSTQVSPLLVEEGDGGTHHQHLSKCLWAGSSPLAKTVANGIVTLAQMWAHSCSRQRGHRDYRGQEGWFEATSPICSTTAHVRNMGVPNWSWSRRCLWRLETLHQDYFCGERFHATGSQDTNCPLLVC